MANSRNDFLKTRVCWGLVLRADIETIEEIKRTIIERPSIEVVYQLIDVGRLWIVRENERNLDFESFAGKCRFKVLDQRGSGVCSYHDSSPGTCAREFCPLIGRRKHGF